MFHHKKWDHEVKTLRVHQITHLFRLHELLYDNENYHQLGILKNS